MMMVVLLGLGIDFTIHLSSRFQEEIDHGKSIEDALRLTIGSTGKGVTTGAFTTSIAFLALMIADAKAVSQFGFCAGTGVLMTLAAALWILPALLASRAEHRQRKEKKHKPAKDFNFLGTVTEKMGQNSRAVIITAVALTLAGITGGYNLQWEYNFMNLEPANLRSVELQDEIVDKFKLSATSSMLTVNGVEESRKIRKKFKAKSVVGDVNDISQWVSRPDFNKNIGHINDIKASAGRNRAATSFNGKANREKLAEQLDRLWANIVEIQALSFTGGQDRVVEKTEKLVGKRENRDTGLLKQLTKKFMDDNVKWNSMNSYSKAFTGDIKAKITTMTGTTKPATLDIIPEDILAQYTKINKSNGEVSRSTEQEFIMHILPKKNLFEKEDLQNFQNIATKIAPGVAEMTQLRI